MKKQTTLFLGTGLSAAPSAQDFVVDGLYAGLAVRLFNFTGTNLQVTATALFEDGFDLGYDAQTANFTPGNKVKGLKSQATGIIVDQVDNGVDGTLTLKRVQGTFFDDEPLVEPDIAKASQGTAVVNGQLVRRFASTGDVWADTGTISADAFVQFVNPTDLAAGDGDRGRVLPRRFRLNFTFNGVTDADIAVDLVQSEVK